MDQRRRVPGRASLEPQRRRGALPLSPGVVILAVAVLGSILFVAYAATVRDPSQIPLLSAGSGVLGIAFAALTVFAATTTYRAGRDGREGRAFAFALLGGISGVVACGAFAAALVLALVLGR